MVSLQALQFAKLFIDSAPLKEASERAKRSLEPGGEATVVFC